MSKTQLLVLTGIIIAVASGALSLAGYPGIGCMLMSIAMAILIAICGIIHRHLVRSSKSNTGAILESLRQNRVVEKETRNLARKTYSELLNVKKSTQFGSVDTARLGRSSFPDLFQTITLSGLSNTIKSKLSRFAHTSLHAFEEARRRVALLDSNPAASNPNGSDPQSATQDRIGIIGATSTDLVSQNDPSGSQKLPERERRSIYEGVLSDDATFQAARKRFEGAKSDLPRVLMVTSNGAGLGHLTRMAAIDRELHAETLIYTMSSAYHRLGKSASEIVYFPSHNDIGMTGALWNGLMESHFKAVVSGFQPDVIVFDGTYVYRGVVAVSRSAKIPVVWVQRGCWKPEVDARSKQRHNPEKVAAKVIVPGDYGCEEIVESGKVLTPVYVPPIVLVRPEELLPREEARRQLDLPLDKNLFLVQLGAGVINDISNIKAEVVARVQSLGSDWEPVIVRNPLADHGDFPTVRSVQAYPLSVYYNAFDAGAFAAGYNTVQESIQFGLPGVFLPNLETKTDDQLRRALAVEEAGLGFSAVTSGQIEDAILRLSEAATRASIRGRMRSTRRFDGAQLAAQEINAAVAESRRDLNGAS